MSSAEENIINTLVQSMQGEKKPEAYDTGATITRIENGVAWVHIPGGVDETPVKLTISAEVGDEVQVRVSGGQAFLVGNATAPPTDNKVANKAAAEASEAAESAEVAVKTAEAAAKIAGDTNQYFWHTEEGADTGAHITEIPREDFIADPENGGGNLLARSNGIALRDGLTELATLQQSGMDVNSYDNQGNLINIAHLGYGYSAGEHGPGDNPYYNLGLRNTTSGIGGNSVSEGYYTEASEWCAHAEGMNTHATAQEAHAEGGNTVASGDSSHAEGFGTVASNNMAHAEGWGTEASGYASHAQGFGTKASSYYQTALGKFNVEDSNDEYAVIIGNGENGDPPVPSNALTVDWNGRVKCGDYAGNLKSIFDIFYPVGSYYETSDTTFNPNTAWGGTWSLEAEGQVHVSAGANYTAGDTGGSENETLTEAKLPLITGQAKLSSNIARNTTGANTLLESASGHFSRVSQTGQNILKATNTSVSQSQTLYTSIKYEFGQSSPTPVSHMQPYVVVNRWHRTA